MKEIMFNNRLGPRSRMHDNILVGVVDSQQVLVLFNGENIPGFAQVTRHEYDKNGKWSADTWTVTIPDDADGFVLEENWELGVYFPHPTWDGAIKTLQAHAKQILISQTAAKRFIRHSFPKSAAKFDLADEELNKLSCNALADILAAQKELEAAGKEYAKLEVEINTQLEARNARQKAAELKEKTLNIKEAMKKGASLDALQAMFKGN